MTDMTPEELAEATGAAELILSAHNPENHPLGFGGTYYMVARALLYYAAENDAIRARVESILAEWDDDNCIDFAYMAEEELTNVLNQHTPQTTDSKDEEEDVLAGFDFEYDSTYDHGTPEDNKDEN